ncbi:MAG: hypothetical protein ACREE1_01535, partial [Stellaceae bacterium]
MKIAPVGVAVLQVDKKAFIMDEVRSGMPGCDVQLDQPVARDPEGGDVCEARTRIVAEITRRRHR